MSDRAPCINPRCRRTYKADGGEVICGKCFRTLPVQLRDNFRRCWREYRKWDRRITQTGDEIRSKRLREVRDRFGALIDRHWDQEIKPFFLTPQKPEGLDAFLEQMGFGHEGEMPP